jgi:septum formation protein
VVISGVDESQVTGSAAEVAETLANRKATTVAATVAATVTHGVVLGCDSVLDFDGDALGKPSNSAAATQHWRRMRGQSGTLVTGHCLVRVDTGQLATAVETTLVRFGRPSDEEIAAYVESGEPLKVAGAFTTEGLGGWFVDGIEGDNGNVVGVSLPVVRRLLIEVGHALTEFWPHPPREAGRQ